MRRSLLLSLPLLALASPAAARTQTDVSPYLELNQIFLADLSGGDGDTQVYTGAAVGVDASIQTSRAEGQASIRYEHQFSWNDSAGDNDFISGLARGRYSLIRDTLSLEAGALATRTRTDGIGANSNLVGFGDGVSNIYSFYAGPALATHVGDLSINGAYLFGYNRIDSRDSFSFPGNDLRLGLFEDSTYHTLTGSVGMRPGVILPVGWAIGGGYIREDQSQLDQRFEDKFVRLDLTLPVSYTLALVGGVGYEDITISARDVLRDTDGLPVVSQDGRYVTDPASPRRLAYDQDGLIWDAGVLWKPSRRTSLEARVGERYGSMIYTGAFSYVPNDRTAIQVALFDGISSFGRQINTGLSSLPTEFEVNRNPFSGDLGGCVGGANGAAGTCFNNALQSLGVFNFRNRGIMAQVSHRTGPWNMGVGAGYASRKFIASNDAVFAGVNGLKDQNYYFNLFFGRQIDPQSGINANIYANYFDYGSVLASDTLNLGAYASYYRNVSRRLSATASLGVDSLEPDGFDALVTGLAQFGLRYQF